MHWIDANSLPEIRGDFERYLLNPHGEADGMIFADGAEVHFPPHLASAVQAALAKDGVKGLRVRGLRPRQGDVFAAVAIETATGASIVDEGPPKKKSDKRGHANREPIETEGVVRRALHGPKGEIRGALLEDGRIVRFAPHEGARLEPLLRRGASLAVRGESLTTTLGIVIEAHAIGRSRQTIDTIDKDKPKKEKPKKPHHAEAHDPRLRDARGS